MHRVRNLKVSLCWEGRDTLSVHAVVFSGVWMIMKLTAIERLRQSCRVTCPEQAVWSQLWSTELKVHFFVYAEIIFPHHSARSLEPPRNCRLSHSRLNWLGKFSNRVMNPISAETFHVNTQSFYCHSAPSSFDRHFTVELFLFIRLNFPQP